MSVSMIYAKNDGIRLVWIDSKVILQVQRMEESKHKQDS